MAIANAGYVPHGHAVSHQSIVRHDESVQHAAPALTYAAPVAHYAAAPIAHYEAPITHYAAPAAHYDSHDEYVIISFYYQFNYTALLPIYTYI